MFVGACVRACGRATDVSNFMFLYQLQKSCEIKDVSEYELRREKNGIEFVFNLSLCLLITHANTCTHIYYLRSCASYAVHAAQHTTHNHNQALSKQRTTHKNTTCCHSTKVNKTK